MVVKQQLSRRVRNGFESSSKGSQSMGHRVRPIQGCYLHDIDDREDDNGRKVIVEYVVECGYGYDFEVQSRRNLLM